jgi:octaprenyl-diphosphate synthase
MTTLKAADLFECVRSGLEATERVLSQITRSDSQAVAALFTQVTRFGGKRLRPALVHLTGGMVGRTTGEHAIIGAIIEALHISSLLHDDVLDEADTRRRVATLNALHGNEVPILLGDLLYSRAFALSLDLSSLHAARELADASVAICRGEIEQSFIRFQTEIDDTPYLAIIQDKTAALYGAACSLGARYAGATELQGATLRAFGTNIGMAFQIIDDCLDVVGDEGVVGKSLGTDLETGKMTLPVLRLGRRLQGAERQRFLEIVQNGAGGARRELLREAFDVEAIVAECQAEANGYIERCAERLAGFADGPERQSLEQLCAFILARDY